jgi:regulator of replication initiation timing
MEGLIPAAIWAKVFSSAAKTTRKAIKPILKSVAVKLGKEMATFGTTDLDSFPVEQTRLMAGRFPPAADIIDQTRKRATWSVWVDPTHLAKALKAIGSVGCDEDDQAVELMFTDNPAKPFVIEAKRAGGIKSTAVVMPLGEKSTIKRKKKTGELSVAETEVTAEVEQLKAHHEEQVKTLKGDLEIARQQIEEHVEENGRLRQEISDLREALNERSQRTVEPTQESRGGSPVVTLSRRERLQRLSA